MYTTDIHNFSDSSSSHECELHIVRVWTCGLLTDLSFKNRIQSLETRKRSLKDDTAKATSKRVKAEVKTEAIAFIPGEVIDLT